MEDQLSFSIFLSEKDRCLFMLHIISDTGNMTPSRGQIRERRETVLGQKVAEKRPSPKKVRVRHADTDRTGAKEQLLAYRPKPITAHPTLRPILCTPFSAHSTLYPLRCIPYFATPTSLTLLC